MALGLAGISVLIAGVLVYIIQKSYFKQKLDEIDGFIGIEIEDELGTQVNS